MSTSSIETRANELVPIADRMRLMHGFRLLAAVCAGLSAVVAVNPLAASTTALIAATVAYLALSFGSHAIWKLSHHGAVALFGAMLIVDGVYLAWASYVTGGAASPLRYMIIVQLIAVALLASYRTGMKLALWNSLLLLVVHYAQEGGVLREYATNTGLGSPLQQLMAFSAAFWIVTLTTATFSAINERELRRRRYDLEALAQMASRVEETTDPAGAAEVLLGSVLDTFDFERGALVDCRDPEHPVILASAGTVEESDQPNTAAGQSALSVAIESRTTQLVTHLEVKGDRWLDAVIPEARNLVIVPLSTERRAIGVFVFEHTMRHGSRIERRVVNTVERFASHGALALRSAWLMEEVRHLATTDVMTGIANRMAFQATLDREIARAARERLDVSVVMLDVDHFKKLNDTLGHQVGDDALREVAQTLAGAARAYDFPARYGGEEFIVILPGTGAEAALRAAERFREAVEGCGAGVTVSGGTATFPLHALDADGLVGAADRALYAAKHAGRNRVSSAPEPEDASAEVAA